MPSDTIAYRCSSNPIGVFNAESMTNANKMYTVQITENGMNTCTCIAFAMKRNKLGGNSAIGTPECTCKHIQAILLTRSACGWSSTLTDEPSKFGVCPRCYNDTEIYDTRDPSTIDLDELMEDFKRLQKKIKNGC